MNELEKLQEERNRLAAEIKRLADKFKADQNKWTDATDEENWRKVNADYDACLAKMEDVRRANAVAERLANVEREQRESVNRTGALPGREDVRQGEQRRELPTEEQRQLGMAAWCRAQMDLDITDEMAEAARLCNIRPHARSLNFNLSPTHRFAEMQAVYRDVHRSRVTDLFRERRAAMSAYDFATGGALVPGTYLQTLEVNMLAFGGILQVADTMTTDRGDRMTWPTADDTSNTGEQVGENLTVDNSNAGGPNPSFGQIFWDAYTFSSKAILVPYTALEDSVFSLPAVLGAMQGERLGRILASKFTTGSGASTPKGIVTAATLGVTAASTTAITYDEVIDLEHSVDPAYRTDAGYMCHDNVVLALRKLKDGIGQYLWQSGIDTNKPDRLNGHPLTVSMEMASSIAASAKTLLFGQLNKYKVRRVGQVRLYRLEERYRDKDQDGFIALMRADGNLLTAGTAPVKYLVQHA